MPLKRREHRQKLLATDPYCFYCRLELTAETATLDHVVPRALGGSNKPSNLRLACRECQRTKADLPIEYLILPTAPGDRLLRIWEAAG